MSSLAAVAALCALALTQACGETVTVGLDDALSSGGTASATGGVGAAGTGGSLELGGVSGTTAAAGMLNDAGAPPCAVTICRGKTYQCGNCLDDDGDGLIDALDPDCLGPCDNDETGFSTGLPSPAAACKQDCYFDGDNGPGNDKCEWSHACDKLSVPPNYPPSGDPQCKYASSGMTMGLDCNALRTAEPPACLDACLPLVPNGCDCFGCCELKRGSGQFHFIGSERDCTRDKLDDPIACPPCTQVGSCINDCTTCETCVSGSPTDPSCGPESDCPAGRRACGPDLPCASGDYCVTGCCVPPPR